MDAVKHMLETNKKITRWASLPEHAPTIGWIVRGEKFYWSPDGAVTTGKKKNKKQPEPQYEIGSITKTMTAFLLAKGEQDGLWQPSDPLAKLIPEWGDREFARQVTLKQLATHTSGLTRLPKNHSSAPVNKDPNNPYASYLEEHLIEAVREESVRTKTQHEYSNYGYGLLGWVMSRASGLSASEALQQELFDPLEMRGTQMPILNDVKSNDTASKSVAPTKTILVPGYAPGARPMPHWDFTSAMAGAGAVRSTVPDMLTYLEAQLGQHPAAASFESALLACQNEQASVAPSKGVGIGYAWMRSMRKDGTVTHWHNGATYGASSFAAFNRDLQSGFVILSNRGVSVAGQIKQMFGLGEMSTDRAAKLISEVLFENV